MQKNIYASVLIFLVLGVSILVMILPTFFTKGVSRVVLHQELKLPLILEDKKKIALVFFGYAGCTSICTPRLQALSEFYTSLSTQMQEKVSVEFLDISIPSDPTLPHSFASVFHKDFKGIYLDTTRIRSYTKAFRVYFAQSLFDTKEFDHSSHLYLVHKEKDTKYLRYIYTAYPFDFKQIHSDLEELTDAY